MMADLDRQGFLTPGTADEQLFFAMLRKDAAWRGGSTRWR